MKKNEITVGFISKELIQRVFIMMKLTIFLVCLSVFSVFANGSYSQNNKISLNLKKTTIQDALKEIENRSNFLFLYNNDLINVDKVVDVNAENESIEEVLNDIFRGEAVKYTVMDRQIIITPDEGAVVSGSQQVKVTGTVTDTNGGPLPGVTVVVKGTTSGTITDFDGKYSISANSTDILLFSFVGMMTLEVPANKAVINVVLEEETVGIEEVVAIGYGVQKKSDVTGAMVSVSAEDLTARPVNNAMEALQGKAAGVDITSNERPGSIGSIRIRGNRSITASNSPLYVVDGVPLMSASAIETLNPRDIESIDVLKDASATAIYGSRGANGVIIVTTKQGKAGQFSLNYSGTVTLSNIVDRNPSMSASEFIDFRRTAAYNLDPTKPSPDSPTYENDYDLFENGLDDNTSWNNVAKGWAGGSWDPSKVTNTDWTDFVTQTGVTQEHTISASGGSDKMRAYGSFGYLKNEGTQRGQWYERYTAKLSTNVKPVEWFEMNASMNVSWSDQDYGMSTLGGTSSSVPDAIYGAAKSIYNFAVPYDEDGNLVINPGGENGMYNIIDEWNKSTQRSQTLRALGNFSATFDLGKMWKPAEGLTYKINFGPDFRHWREGAYVDGTSVRKLNADGSAGKNYARLQNRRDFSWTLDNMVNFDRTFANVHKVGVTLLQTASSWNIESSSMSAYNIAKPSYLWNAMGSIDVTNSDYSASMSSDLSERQLTSYMVRLNYGFNERYLLTVSGRWDGASQLAAGHKWDFFPSAAIGWRVNQEDFLKDVSWLDNLKLRLGVGTTGNAAVDPYATLGDITAIYLPFNGMDNVLGYTTNEPYYTRSGTAMANSDLGWEKTTQYNLGIDFSVIRGRISGSIDAYRSFTSELLMSMTIPTLTGYSTTYANVGKTNNRGVELTLNFIPVETNSGFTWDSNFNVAWQKDEIDELAYGKNDMRDNAWFIGESIGVYYGYDNLGLWQDTEADQAEMALWREKGRDFEPGNVRPKDQNGDYVMDSEDMVILGNTTPHWTMGWNNNFSYKGFELGVTMYSRMGYMKSLGGQALTAHANQTEVDYWTPTNTDAEFQKPIIGQATSGSVDKFSSLLGYKNAAFVKIRNISLGYNFPKSICSKIGVGNLKVYGQAVNPGSIYQSVDWYDFDVSHSYYNRSFVFGVEVGL